MSRTHSGAVRALLAMAPLPFLLAPLEAAAQNSSPPGRDIVELQNPGDGLRDRADNVIDRTAEPRLNCPFENSDLRATINQVYFSDPNGNPIDSELAESLAYVRAPGGSQPLSVVCDLRDEANKALREDRWIATVQIPEQDLIDSLRLDVVSARISELRVTGDVGPYEDMLSRQLGKLQSLNPLNERDAERILILANEIPGVDLRLSLAPAGGEVGEVVGNVVVGYEPYAVYFNARNYNSKRIGRETAYGRFEYYGLTGLADLTFIGAQTTIDFEEQVIVQGGHEFALNSDGLRLGGQITHAWSKPDFSATGANLDLDTKTLVGNLELTYPVARRPDLAIDLSSGFDFINQKTDAGIVALNKDALRVAYVRADMEGQGNAGGLRSIRYKAFFEARKGLDVFGATQIPATGFARTDGVSASRPFGDAEAFVIRVGADVSLPIIAGVGAKGRLEGQWADEPLLNFEEYSLGNLSIGRGYDPGANSGDRAVAWSLEMTFDAITGRDPNVQLFGFYDRVTVRNLDPFTPDPSRTLASAGGGIRAYLSDGLQLEVAYAKPLDRALFSDTERPPGRVLVSLTTKFPSLLR